MRILILNWRDIKNPQSGGAEVLTHEIAKRLVRNKHKVIQFSARFPGSKKTENIDGVTIVRDGNPDMRTLFSSVHYKAYRYYKKNLEGKVDLVIDEIHGIPFFTPLYVKEKKVVLICEVAGKLWDKAAKFPFNKLGRLIETIYPNFYQRIQIATISKSSQKELINLGFKKDMINIIPLGCDMPIIKNNPVKSKYKTIIYVGRITPAKGIWDAIDVVEKLKKDIPDIRFWVIGRGKPTYVKDLKKRISKLGLSDNIKFWGFVPASTKSKLLERSHVLVSPSQKEGWGLTVHEAGARGTPSVTYDVEGLREVLVNGKNGLLCKKNNPLEMSNLVKKILSDKVLYKSLQKGAIDERKKFTWDKTYQEFIRVIR